MAKNSSATSAAAALAASLRSRTVHSAFTGAEPSRGLVRRYHEARNHFLDPGLVEVDVELFAFGRAHAPIAELAVKDARTRRKAGLARADARLTRDLWCEAPAAILPAIGAEAAAETPAHHAERRFGDGLQPSHAVFRHMRARQFAHETRWNGGLPLAMGLAVGRKRDGEMPARARDADI